MKIGRLIDPRFQDVVRRLQTAHIPLKGAYKLKGVVKAIDEELKKYEELRKGAVEKYGKRDDGGALVVNENNSVQFEEAQGASFSTEMNELLALDVPMTKLSVGDLGDSMVLSVEDLFFIEGLLED